MLKNLPAKRLNHASLIKAIAGTALLLGAVLTCGVSGASASGITYQNSVSAANNTATTLTLPVPGGTSAGDVLIASIDVEHAPSITLPAGWTPIRTDINPNAVKLLQADYYHVAGSNEPAAYSWTFSAADGASGGIIDYRGVDNSNPVDATSGVTTAVNANPIVAASVTVAAANEELIGIFGNGVNRTQTVPAGMTQRYTNSSTADGQKTTTYAFDQTLASSGATGTRSSSPNGSSVGIGQLIALKPAPPVNNPPVVDSVTINQANPQTNDTLSANVQAHDPDGTPITLSYQWVLNGFNIPGAISPTLDLSQPGNGNRGDMIQLTVTANDGQLNSQPVTSAPVTVADTAPTISNLSLSPSQPQPGAILTASLSGSDADNDTINYSYAWSVNGNIVQTDSSNSTTDTFDSTNYAQGGDTVAVSVTPNDGTLTGASLQASTTVAQPNQPPVIDLLTISPNQPKTNDLVSAVVSGHDPDGDPVTYSYQWAVNGVNIAGATNSTLDLSQAGNGNKGDVVSVTVIASDGSLTSQPAMASQTVADTPPAISSITLSPSNPLSTDNLTAGVTASDADGDEITYTYVWTDNSSVVQTDVTASATDSLYLPNYAKAGDTVVVQVTPSDGTASGSPRQDSTVIAQPNQPPVVDSVQIAQSNPQTNDTLSLLIASHDPDGDSLSYTYQWHDNGVDIPGATAQTLDLSQPGNGNKGDSITATVTAFDGQLYSQPLTSAPVTIVDSPPVISGLNLTPSSPHPTDTLSASVSASDADSDPISFSYAWSVNGTLVQTDNTSATSDSFNLTGQAKAGDSVSVSVMPSDGTASGAASSASATVQPASGFGQITEYPIPGSAVPANLTAGPDGNIWFDEESLGAIGSINVNTGAMTLFQVLPSGDAMGAMSVGSDSRLWISEGGLNKIGAYNITTGNYTQYSLPSSATPAGNALGPDGNIWVSEFGISKIARVTPSGAVTQFATPTSSAQPHGMTKGPDGNMWFTEYHANKIGRITMTGVITEFPIPTANAGAIVITPGPDGNLWFTEQLANKIGRITPAGVITEFSTGANTMPVGITWGPDGNLWFAEQTANKIASITTSGIITTYTIPSPSTSPNRITVGSDGNLWFTEHATGRIGSFALH